MPPEMIPVLPFQIAFVPILVDTGAGATEMMRDQARREYVKSVASGTPASEAHRVYKDRVE